VFFSSCLTEKRLPNAPSDALPVLRLTPLVGEVEQSMTGARQTVALTITFRKSNKNSLELRAGGYWPSIKKHLIFLSCRGFVEFILHKKYYTRTGRFQMDEGVYVRDLGSKRSEDFVSTVDISRIL